MCACFDPRNGRPKRHPRHRRHHRHHSRLRRRCIINMFDNIPNHPIGFGTQWCSKSETTWPSLGMTAVPGAMADSPSLACIIRHPFVRLIALLRSLLVQYHLFADCLSFALSAAVAHPRGSMNILLQGQGAVVSIEIGPGVASHQRS